MKYTEEATDDQLIEEYLCGNTNNIEVLVKRHKIKVYSYILKVTKDKTLTDDIFQETFIKALKNVESNKYKQNGKFIQWALKIAHYTIIDHFRSSQKANAHNISIEDNDIAIDTESLDHNLLGENTRIHIKKLVEELPKEQRDIINMRYYNELSFKEIANGTGVSINTSLGRMRYALTNLRKRLKGID